MFELLTMFLTGGGSAALGSILKGVFGTIADNRQQKFELELAREARGNEFALKFQEQLNNGPGGAFTRATRRLLAPFSSQRSQQSSSSAPSSQVQKSSPSLIQAEKGLRSFSLGLSLFQQSKPLYR